MSKIITFSTLNTKLQNFDFSKLPIKKIYEKLNYKDVYKIIFTKEELEFIERSITSKNFTGYDEFIVNFEKKIYKEIEKYESTLPKKTDTFEFRALREDIIFHLKKILKKEYLIEKMWVEKSRGFLYLNIKIFAYSKGELDEIYKELEREEENLIEKADRKTRCPIDPVWDTDEHLANQYRQIDNWYNTKNKSFLKI